MPANTSAYTNLPSKNERLICFYKIQKLSLRSELTLATQIRQANLLWTKSNIPAELHWTTTVFTFITSFHTYLYCTMDYRPLTIIVDLYTYRFVNSRKKVAGPRLTKDLYLLILQQVITGFTKKTFGAGISRIEKERTPRPADGARGGGWAMLPGHG